MSIKEISKQRILDHMVGRVRHASVKQVNEENPYGTTRAQKYCAMIVDDASLRILSSCCKVYDILEEGVTVVENILKKRQPLPELDSIYFLTPELSSVESLCRDFSNDKQPQYKSVHLFFTLPIPPKSGIMESMAKYTGLLSRLHTCVEFNLGFISYEKRVFHFDMPDVIPKLFPPTRPEILHEIADKLLSVCVTLGDKPNIRFHNNSFRLNEQLASILHQRLTKLDVPGLTRGKTKLIIVDRSIDLPPLFLHEYTYQACIYDLLDVPVCTPVSQEPKAEGASDVPIADDTIQYPVVTNEGKHEARIALLSEADDVYVRYRHQHIMVAKKKVPEEIKKFLSENATAKLSKRKDMSNEEMQRAIRDLPEYQEMLAKFSVHHSITQRCMQELHAQGVSKVGPLEQDLATGVDSTGKEVVSKNNLSSLGKLLSDASIGMEEKLRLLLLYFSMTLGVKDDDKRKMMEAAQLPLENSSLEHVLPVVGLEQAASDQTPVTSHTHKLQKDKERSAFFSNRARNVEMALSRFQPYIKDIMEKTIQDALHGGRFPYVAQVAHRGNIPEPEARAAGVHVRARNKDWDFDGGEAGATTPRAISHDTATGKLQFSPDSISSPLIVFVLGGITMSEMRSAYEVSRQLGCEVFIGGTHIFTPRSFLNSLKESASERTQFWQS